MKLITLVAFPLLLAACATDQRNNSDGIYRDNEIQREEEILQEEEARTGQSQSFGDDGVFNPYGL